MTCPGPLLCLACLGGGGPVLVPPYLASGRVPPVGQVRGVRVPGGGLGGGGAARAPSRPFVRPGGPVGRGSLCLASFLCLPWAGTKAAVTGVVLVMGGVARIPLWFVLARLLSARSVRRPGALARACLFRAVPVGAGGWGGGAGRAPAPPSGGGGGDPPCPGAVEAGAPAACGPVGGVKGGGSRCGLPAPPLGGGPRFPTLAPVLSSAHSPPACAFGRGRGAALRGGGMRGGPWAAPLGAPSDLNPPSALPEWAMVTGGSPRARPRYCSGAPPCAAPRLGLRPALARWCGLARRLRPPREQAAGGAGARGVQVQPHPPPPRVAVPSGGGGASSRLRQGGGSLM